MPKITNLKSSLKTFLSQNSDTFELRSDSIDCNEVFCRYCKVNLKFSYKYDLEHHLAKSKHKKCVLQHEQNSSSTLSQEDFNSDIGNFCVGLNIPIDRVNDIRFKHSFEKYTNFQVPSSASLRNKVLPNLYDNTIDYIRSELS